MKAGINEIGIEAKYIKGLAKGVYYYVIEVADDKGKTAKSKVEKIILF